MPTSRELHERLNTTAERLDHYKREIDKVSEEAERTKVRLVEAANGSYVRLKEMLDGKGNKG